MKSSGASQLGSRRPNSAPAAGEDARPASTTRNPKLGTRNQPHLAHRLRTGATVAEGPKTSLRQTSETSETSEKQGKM
jgi:hypothetical protein